MLTKSIDDLIRETLVGIVGEIESRIKELDGAALTSVAPDYPTYRSIAGRRQGLAEALQIIKDGFNERE